MTDAEPTLPPGPKQFLTVEQTAEVLQVSDRTVRRWIDDGDLVAHRFGRQLRIAPADLNSFIRMRREP